MKAQAWVSQEYKRWDPESSQDTIQNYGRRHSKALGIVGGLIGAGGGLYAGGVATSRLANIAHTRWGANNTPLPEAIRYYDYTNRGASVAAGEWARTGEAQMLRQLRNRETGAIGDVWLQHRSANKLLDEINARQASVIIACNPQDLPRWARARHPFPEHVGEVTVSSLPVDDPRYISVRRPVTPNTPARGPVRATAELYDSAANVAEKLKIIKGANFLRGEANALRSLSEDVAKGALTKALRGPLMIPLMIAAAYAGAKVGGSMNTGIIHRGRAEGDSKGDEYGYANTTPPPGRAKFNVQLSDAFPYEKKIERMFNNKLTKGVAY